MRYAAFIFLACSFLQAQTLNQLSPAEKAAGWKLLFDGKTFQNWADPTKKSPPGDAWSIEDNCLKANTRPKIREDLFSVDKFHNFELEFDWKISKAGNSGVKYRIQRALPVGPRSIYSDAKRFEETVLAELKNPHTTRQTMQEEYVVGFEYQVIDDAENKDAKSTNLHTAGALYDMVAPTNVVLKPVGEFNHSRIVLKDNHVEHWLNGTKVVDAMLNSEAVKKSVAKRWTAGSPMYHLLVDQPERKCPISLQNHNDAAWFRNIKIRPLD